MIATDAGMDLSRAIFRSEPYIIGLATEIFEPWQYTKMIAAYPAERDFAHMAGAYEKFSLSERNNPDRYLQAIQMSPLWTAFHGYIKSARFLDDVWRCVHTFRPGAWTLAPSGVYRSRFEFSSMPAHGGMIWPHTDIPSKVVTLIVPMMASGDWDPAWGGSTDVLVPKPGVMAKDYKTPLEQFDIVASYPCAPNQAVIFLKWANSWHSVGPIRGPLGVWRRTLTINIERVA